jgi:HEXXH motif-containing protein
LQRVLPAPDDGDALRALGALRMPTLRTSHTNVHVLLPWVGAHPALFPIQAALSPLDSTCVVELLQAGWDLLSTVDPVLEDFCAGVLSDVFALDGRDGLYRSGSDAEALGMIALSVPAPAIMVAELFVHECAHQYFHLACEFGPVDDGSDRQLYWSPLKHEPRPIDRLLIAHHALANIAAFYSSVIERGLDEGGYAARGLQEHASMLRELERSLDVTRALTDIGLALYLRQADTAYC